MSKYKEITTQIFDPEHITLALDDLGIPYEVAPVGQTLTLNGWGRQGKSAEIVVRKDTMAAVAGQHSMYGDMGWSLDPETGTYRLTVDDLDEGWPGVKSIVEGVAQRSAFYRLQELASQAGFAADSQVEFDVQRIRLSR